MDIKPVSRRNFLKISGIGLTASVATFSGFGFMIARRPEIETPEMQFRKGNIMNKRVLVTYATRAGSTVEVAAFIGKTIATRGFTVDIKPVKENPALNGYQAIILGSAVRMGKWLPEAVKFVKENREALNKTPVALFTMHMLNRGDDEESRTNRLTYLNSVRPMLNQAEEVFFAGRFDMSRLSFMDKMISKAVKAVDEDCRDWDKIKDWAQNIFAKEENDGK